MNSYQSSSKNDTLDLVVPKRIWNENSNSPFSIFCTTAVVISVPAHISQVYQQKCFVSLAYSKVHCVILTYFHSSKKNAVEIRSLAQCLHFFKDLTQILDVPMENSVYKLTHLMWDTWILLSPHLCHVLSDSKHTHKIYLRRMPCCNLPFSVWNTQILLSPHSHHEACPYLSVSPPLSAPLSLSSIPSAAPADVCFSPCSQPW